jgi:hypothetical protein
VGATRFLFLLLGGMLCVIAAFLLAGGFLVAAAVTVGLGFLLVTLMAVQSRLFVERYAVVNRVMVEEYDGFRRIDAGVVVEGAGHYLGTLRYTTDEPPRLGDRVVALVPMHRRGGGSVLWDRAGPPGAGATLMFRKRGITFEGPHRLLFGRPVWAERSAEQVLEFAAEVIADVVLGWYRARGWRLATQLESTPEFLNLAPVFELGFHTVAGRALKDQGKIFDATETSRHAALRRAAPLPLLALVAVPIAVFVLPDLVRVPYAVLESLFAGSVQPFREAVRWAAATRGADLPQLDLYVLLVCAAVLAVAVLWRAGRATAAAVSAYEAWHADLAAVVRRRLLDEYSRVANAKQPPELRIRTASGLAGLAADQAIKRAEAEQLRALAFELGAGAVAISGSRGVGKTTLLSMLTSPDRPDTLGLVVAAPVRYEPRDFLLHLYAQLCNLVLARLGDQRARSRMRRRLTRLRRTAGGLTRAAAFLCLLVVFFTGTREWLAERLPLPVLPATWFFAGLTLLALAAWVRGPEPAREIALAAEAARRLQQTRYLQTLSGERSAGLGQSALQFGWRRSRQWAEQPHTLPEVVRGYREFVAEVAAWWRAETGERGKLLIAIDEADRIADPQAAELFVNEIKSIFGVPHCVYLVSVSEEALANFERRVVRMRTVFDSAFDHVVRLRPLALGESVALLRNRLAGVPDRFLALCHCMAGGMPRDVLRTARTMLDLHRASLGVSLVPDLASGLVSLEVQAVKRGFRHQPAAGEPDPKLSELLADPVWPGTTGAEIRDAAEEQLAAGSVAATAIGAALLYYATVLDLFTGGSDLLDVEDDGLPEPELITDLARVHSMLAVDPAVAVQQLRRIQAYLGAE